MKMFYRLIFTVLFIGFINAQSLDETLSQLAKEAAVKYVEPIGSAFGSNLNSGWFTKAPDNEKLGLDISLKIVGSGTFISDKAKTFNLTGNFKVTGTQADNILANSGILKTNPAYNVMKQELLAQTWKLTFNGPTINGKKSDRLKIYFPGATIQGQQIKDYEETISSVKGLLDEMPIFPLGVPQLTVGTIMGTNVSFRYLPTINIENIGDTKFSGFGITHNPAVWFNVPLPVDIALGYYYQSLDAGSKVETSASQFGIYVSKQIGIGFAIIPYAGLTFESSKTKVNYDYSYTNNIDNKTFTDKISFEFDGENTTSFLIGTSLKFSIINLNIDYKATKYSTISAGLAFDLF